MQRDPREFGIKAAVWGDVELNLLHYCKTEQLVEKCIILSSSSSLSTSQTYFT